MLGVFVALCGNARLVINCVHTYMYTNHECLAGLFHFRVLNWLPPKTPVSWWPIKFARCSPTSPLSPIVHYQPTISINVWRDNLSIKRYARPRLWQTDEDLSKLEFINACLFFATQVEVKPV